MSLENQRLEAARGRAVAALRSVRTAGGHWEGELSSSALSTATAVGALAVALRHRLADAHPSGARLEPAIETGLRWLAENVNPDGGWGDTVLSVSNISTTTLCWAAFGAVSGADLRHQTVVERAREWLAGQAGTADEDGLAQAILRRYGKDRTFSVPILTMCALAGRLGQGRSAWRRVLALPFELAVLPYQWFAALRLPVVSYALPALIAMGQAHHFHCPTRNPVRRAIRNLTRQRTLGLLEGIQPASGGFLEATPLTSFVTMSLAGSGLAEHPVAERGLTFLLGSQRPDGSWPIDTNLATWVTTLAVNALQRGPEASTLPADEAQRIAGWLLDQQHLEEHPYTHAAPGGWAWTNLSGGVPDADDTAGALLALRALPARPGLLPAAERGIGWLLGLQNHDGGIPTFCRGWGALPFDRSSPDLTAHALRAWVAWRDEMPPALAARLDSAIDRSLDFLGRTQRPDGTWNPLWFGNQHSPEETNPVYGTSRVLRALAVVASRLDRSARTGPSPSQEPALQGLGGRGGFRAASEQSHDNRRPKASDTPKIPAAPCEAYGRPRRQQQTSQLERIRVIATRGLAWLCQAQNEDGSWGGSAGTPGSTEETALAVEALAAASRTELGRSAGTAVRRGLDRGVQWLVQRIESGQWTRPVPIGFYFAKLWYFERLYPLIWTVSALNEVTAAGEGEPNGGALAGL